MRLPATLVKRVDSTCCRAVHDCSDINTGTAKTVRSRVRPWLPAVATSALELFYAASTPEATVLETADLARDESCSAFLEIFNPSRSSCPCWWLSGQSDGIFSEADLRATAKFFAAPTKLYANTGHNLMLEPNRKKIALEILAWLGSVKPSSA